MSPIRVLLLLAPFFRHRILVGFGICLSPTLRLGGSLGRARLLPSRVLARLPNFLSGLRRLPIFCERRCVGEASPLCSWEEAKRGRFAYGATLASSTYRQRAFASCIWRGFLHSGSSRRGLPTIITIAWAREVATFSRFKL